jgi:hypothetical protein
LKIWKDIVDKEDVFDLSGKTDQYNPSLWTLIVATVGLLATIGLILGTIKLAIITVQKIGG